LIQHILNIKSFFEQFFDSFISFLKVILFSKFIVSKKKSLQNKSCVILGNGPSLNDSMRDHADFIAKSEVFCVNLFATSEYYIKLKPNNYLLLDEAFLDPNHPRACLAIKHLVADTAWPVNLFAPFKFQKSEYFRNCLSKNPNLKPIYFNYVIFEGFDWLRFMIYKYNLGMPQCQNVLVALLLQCINLGYKNIYLLGADHTWHETLRLDENNKLYLNDTHFYGARSIDVSERVLENNSYMALQFLSLHKAFKGYEVIARYAKYCGAKVYNASKRSYIDVFEKIKLE
jgi:hypothetical protein